MHIAHQEPPRRQPLRNVAQLTQRRPITVSRASVRRAAKPLQHPRPVRIRLQPPDALHSRVAQGSVIKIHRILRRDHDADPERARLLHQ